MNVRKFIAANAREALRKVKETLGPDAIILSNRGVPGGVEIMAVAARDMAMMVPNADDEAPAARPQMAPQQRPLPPPPVNRRPTSPSSPSSPATIEDDDYRVSLSGGAPSAVAPPPPSIFGPKLQPSRPTVPPPLPREERLEPPVTRMGTIPPPMQQTAPNIPPPPMTTMQGGAVPRGVPRPAVFRNISELQPPRMVADPPMTQGLQASSHSHVAHTSVMQPPVVQEHAANRVATQVPALSPREAEGDGTVPVAVMEEIRALRRIVEQHLAGFAWGETGRTEPVKIDVLRQMLDLGFSPQFSRELLTDLPSDLDVAQAMVWVRGAADRTLMTVGPEADIIERGGVYALVGPTGVGKTTTTAKLAARSVLRQGPNRVALITTDGYRIGAHEQLRIYGRILGVSVYLVKDAAELRQTLGELQHKHLVLVDTMGMSQKDKSVPELTGMLSDCNVRRLLLFSATSRGDTLDDIIRSYQGPELVGCVLTKVDEAASLATALDAIMRNNLRLFYVSNGQRVPEDLHLPNRAYLLHRAFKDLPEGSAHRFDGVEPGLVMASAGVFASGGSRG